MDNTASIVGSSTSPAEQLQQILNGTTCRIYLIDRDQKILYASPEALRDLGMSEDEVIGKRFRELGTSAFSTSESDDFIHDAFRIGEITSSEVSYNSPRGKLFYLADAVPLVQDGQIDRLVLTVRDITARKVSENFSGMLNRIYAAVSSTLSFQEIMRRVVEISSNTIESEATAVALLEGDKWILRFTHGIIPDRAIGHSLTDEQMRSCFLSEEECISGIMDIRKTDWVSQEMMRRFNILSFVSVPLKIRSKVIGVLIFAFAKPRSFSPEEMDFANKLSIAVSLALENSNLYRQELDRRLVLQTILDDLPAVVIALNGKDLTIKWANRYSNRYRFGELATKSTVGMSLENIFPKEAQGAVLEMFKAVARTGRPFYHDEFMLTGLGSEVIYWSGALVPVRLDDSEDVDLLILAVDITAQVNARKRSEELARRAEEERKQLQTVLDTLPIGAALLDRSGRVVELNPTAKRFWGAILPSFRDVRDLENVLAWNTDTGVSMSLEDWGMVKAVFEGKTTLNETVTLKRYDQREMIMSMSSSPLLDANESVIGAVIIGQDLSRQVQMQLELLEAKTRAEMYVDLLTHDINNLNAAAMGYLQLIQSSEAPSEKAASWTAHALESLEESTRLIDNIRDIQDIEVGGQELEIINLTDVLARVASEHGRYPSREVDIEMDMKGNVCVFANRLVFEVFSNIVDNAIRHSTGPISITIKVSSEFENGREYHRVDVEDNGPGIQDDLKERIFTRAWRGRTKAVGRGLGLFLVRRLVEDFNGRVWVEDRVFGDYTKGSRFVVLLPALECPGQR